MKQKKGKVDNIYNCVKNIIKYIEFQKDIMNKQ